MKRFRQPKLNIRILAVFFVGIFVLAMAELFVFSHLLGTMRQEEALLNEERMNNAQMKVESALTEVSDARGQMLAEPLFYAWSIKEMSLYRLGEMVNVTENLFGSIDCISSYCVFLKGTEYAISSYGVCTRDQYHRLCGSDVYPTEYWESVYENDFGVYYYPQAAFHCSDSAKMEEKILIPLSMESQFNDRFMVLLFLDAQMLFRDSDSFLSDGTYVFFEDTLVYTTDAEPVIDRVCQSDNLTNDNGEQYTVQSRTLERNRITLVKLQPEREATAFLRRNFVWCGVVAVGALVISTILILFSVRRMMEPVNKIFELILQHSEAKDPGFRFDARKELEVILKNREQQAAALAQRDAVLSEYLLQSRLKDLYVDPDSGLQPGDGTTYILYIQVQYRENCQQIQMSRQELDNCLQTIFTDALNGLFDSRIVFQLEPGRFAAQVTLHSEDERMESRMERFMKRLEIEQEFAWFTVIQSTPLDQQEDLSRIYKQVQEAARHAQVCDRSQLLTLPLSEEERSFGFSQEQETRLITYLSRQEMAAAAELAEQILQENLQAGISHTQMEVLCVALVNTAAQAVTKLSKNADKIAAASGVYNVITSRCNTAQEYSKSVMDFIYSVSDGDGLIPKEDPLLAKVNRYLQENYSREFSGEEMAEDLGVSRSHLSTYYKNKTGINLNESVQIFRMQKAVELLQDPDIRIGDVGVMVGIPSSNTFLRWFKKHTGMTPNEYRAKL